MIDLLLKLLGDPNQKKVKKMMPVVEHINKLEPEMEKPVGHGLHADSEPADHGISPFYGSGILVQEAGYAIP